MTNDVYFNIAFRYFEADKESRQASKDHWIECHKINVSAHRKDLIIFSAQILAWYDIIDSFTDKEELNEFMRQEFFKVADNQLFCTISGKHKRR